MSAVTHPRLAPRRGTAGATWWSKAVLRAVEEAAYTAADLKAGRALARNGAVGGIGVDAGSAVAAVTEGHDAYTVEVTVPVLDEVSAATFVEIVGAQSGRIGALLSGQLPHQFVEAVEEAGVELLPYGGELGSACSCEAWLDPCPHALAVLTQLAWLIQVDPFVLTHLRGLPRDRVLRDLHQLTVPREPGPAARAGSGGDGLADPDNEGPDNEGEPDDLAIAQDAAERALRAMDLLLEGRVPEEF